MRQVAGQDFYKPDMTRTLVEIQADIGLLETETEDLITEIRGARHE